jgi:hypothetical protein
MIDLALFWRHLTAQIQHDRAREAAEGSAIKVCINHCRVAKQAL